MEAERLYRQRIYNAYVNARGERLAPDSLAGLRSRGHYLTGFIKRFFPAARESRVLDLGCGHGALLHFAGQLGYRHLRGVDGSPEQVAAAKALGIPCVELGDLFQTLAAQADDSLDVVVAFDVLEHLDRDEGMAFADEVLRVLRPGGRWLIHVPNGESPCVGRILYSDLTHEMAFTRISIAQMLYTCGFSQVHSFEDRPVVHGLLSVARGIGWRLIRIFWLLYIAAETGSRDRRAIFTQNLIAVAYK